MLKKLKNIPKEQVIPMAVCVVLALIFIINTVALLFVANKVINMDAAQSQALEKDLEELEQPKRVEEIRKELEALEKADTKSDTTQK